MKEHFPEIAASPVASRSFFVERHIASRMTSAHWHDHVELNLLLEGSMTYLFNGRQQHVEAGRMVLFWAAIPHQTIQVTPDAPLICIYLPLVDFLALPIDQASRQMVMQGRFVTERSDGGGAPGMARRWSGDWETGSEQRRQLVRDEVKLAVRRLILDHAACAGAHGSGSAPLTPSVRHTQVLTELINRHFAGQLTLDSLARRANVHATTANRAFREVLGMSVMEYLTRYRLARAMQRLAETDDPVLEIALDCGFGSSARFYSIFKQRSGSTPRGFRREIRAG